MSKGRCAVCGQVHDDPATEADLARLGGRRGVLNSLAAIIEGKFRNLEPHNYPPSSPMSLRESVSTIIELGPNGESRTLTTGSRLEPFDVSKLDAAVVAKVEAAMALSKNADDKSAEVQKLLGEISALEKKVERAKVRFNHAVWGRFRHLRGDDDFEIAKETNELFIVKQDDREIGRMAEDGQALFNQQTAIEDDETAISDTQDAASELQSELQHLPELVEVEMQQATEDLMTHLEADHGDLHRQVLTHQAILIEGEEGKLEILVRQRVHEIKAGLSPMDRDILAAMHRYGNLPDNVAARLGLPVTEPKPELDAPAKDEVPAGTFMAQATAPDNGNGQHHADIPDEDTPVLMAADEVPEGELVGAGAPLDHADGGTLGD